MNVCLNCHFLIFFNNSFFLSEDDHLRLSKKCQKVLKVTLPLLLHHCPSWILFLSTCIFPFSSFMWWWLATLIRGNDIKICSVSFYQYVHSFQQTEASELVNVKICGCYFLGVVANEWRRLTYEALSVPTMFISKMQARNQLLQ